MPVVVQPIEPHIYYTRWQGITTRESFIEGTRARLELADSSGDPYYLLIFDFSQAILATSDLRAVRKLIEPKPHLVRFIFVGSPLLARIASGAISSISSSKPVELYSDYDIALRRARILLNEYERQLSPQVK